MMFAVAVTKSHQLEIVEVPQPEPAPYQALIRTEIAALCNMTDRKVIHGDFPGLTRYPLLLGHETVGVVEKVGAKVRSFKVGDRVVGGLVLSSPHPDYGSGWGGFSQFTLAGDHKAMVEDGVADADHDWFEVYEIMRVVPHSISLEDSVLLCTWREVYGAFGDFHLKAGDNIVVYGGGPVGLSFVKFGRMLGLGEIYLVDRWEHKRQKAMEMGATAAYAPDDPMLSALFARRKNRFDALIDAVGKEEIINQALTLIKMGGSICVYGVIDTPMVRLDKHAAPYNFNLFIHQWPTRWREHDAQEPLVAWIEAGKLSYREFVSGEFPIHDIAHAFEWAVNTKAVKTLFHY
jgi:2-desacetyl-2-hydroxyethyl bacteriochlorophyllide A dehydrogenase